MIFLNKKENFSFNEKRLAFSQMEILFGREKRQ